MYKSMGGLFLTGILLLAVNGCGGGAGVTTVKVAATPTTIHSTQTSAIVATIEQQPPGSPVPVPAPASTVDFSPAAHMAPRSAGSRQGRASTTFTGPAVDRDTPVTVAAKYGNTTGSVQVLVRPAVATASFAGSTTAGDDVTISPSVRERSSGVWQFIYIIQEGSAAQNIRNVSVSFSKPVTITSNKGTVRPPTGQHRNFAVTATTPTTGMTGPITITASGDVEPGGTAAWDIIDLAIAHARLSTTGPK